MAGGLAGAPLRRGKGAWKKSRCRTPTTKSFTKFAPSLTWSKLGSGFLSTVFPFLFPLIIFQCIFFLLNFSFYLHSLVWEMPLKLSMGNMGLLDNWTKTIIQSFIQVSYASEILFMLGKGKWWYQRPELLLVFRTSSSSKCTGSKYCALLASLFQFSVRWSETAFLFSISFMTHSSFHEYVVKCPNFRAFLGSAEG